MRYRASVCSRHDSDSDTGSESAYLAAHGESMHDMHARMDREENFIGPVWLVTRMEREAYSARPYGS